MERKDIAAAIGEPSDGFAEERDAFAVLDAARDIDRLVDRARPRPVRDRIDREREAPARAVDREAPRDGEKKRPRGADRPLCMRSPHA